MTDYAPDFTPRYRVEYVSAGLTHHMMLRGFRGESLAATDSRARNAIHDALAPLVAYLPSDFAFVSAEVIPQDSNVSSPGNLPGAITGTVDPADMSAEDKIRTLGWVGRSASTPMRLFVFGFTIDTDVTPADFKTDFRITAAELAAVSNSIAGLNAAGVPANNNLPGTWKSYVNLKVNDEWLKKVRKGSVT